MVTMTYDKYEEICCKMDELPNVIDEEKGLTEEDLQKMLADPDKYLLMAMYYLSRNYADDKIFSNDDAIPASELKLELNNMIKNNVHFVESEDESNDE